MTLTKKEKAKAKLLSVDIYVALCGLLEWAKGNRGPKNYGPYGVPEVRKALEVVARIQDIGDYLDAKTNLEKPE